MSHQVGEGYSARNPVPTVEAYLKTQHPPETYLDRSLPPTPAANGPSEKDRILAQSKKSNPIDQAKANHRDNTVVNDPTTHAPVHLENSKPSDDKNYHKQLDPANADHAGPALNQPMAPMPGPFKVTPNSVPPSNILLQQFPPPIEAALVTGLTSRLRQLEVGLTVALSIVWFFVAFGSGKWAFLLRSSLLGMMAFGAVTALHLVERQILRNMTEVRMQMERQRGEEHSPPTPESVEWLNSFLATVWPLIPPETFTALADTIEDVMQASLPKFVTAVRIADLSQGRNPLRIVAIRGLPDQQGSRLKHGDDWIDQGKNPSSPLDTKDPEAALEAEDQADQAGDFVNLEVSLAYMSVPKKEGQAIHADNAHLMLEFFVGLAGWARIPIRIWVEVAGIVATARIRLQVVEQVPFVRNSTITLMDTPYVDVSAVPLSRALPNVLDLPLISSFVQSSIAAACQMYIAPQSITMNLAQLLLGDGTKKDTLALGVLKVTVHRAEGLQAADINGKSDPYVVAAWSKFGKPLYSTRVMVADLNPVWEETFFLLVTQDEITAEEKLSIQLWDSDARSADDVLGRIEVDLLDIIKTPNKMTQRSDKLQGFEESETLPGRVVWSYGYYGKVALEQGMKDKADAARAAGPIEAKSAPASQPTVADTPLEAASLDTPPNPNYPSGIFSILISNINNLENQNVGGQKSRSMSKIAGKPGQPTADDAELETHSDLPSSYCEIMINDDLVYRTRTKEMTSAPYFAAGTERFIRDFHTTTVRVAVRDARLREHDALLGVVTLPLGELFKTQSQVNRLWSLQDGVGFGRVNISILFKAVDLGLPPSLRGWETGTVEVLSDIRASGLDASYASKKLLIRTTDDVEKIPGSLAKQDGSDIVWALSKTEPAESRRISVYHRFASALVLDIGGTKPDAVAVLWLQDIPDDEEREVELDIMQGTNLQQLQQCYINDSTAATHPYHVAGKVRFKVRFDPGLDADHAKLTTDERKQHSYDTYMAAEGMNEQLAEAREGRAEDDPKSTREKKLEREDLHRRGRGVMQVKPMRTGKWMGDGLKSKVQSIKTMINPSLKAQQPDVETEV